MAFRHTKRSPGCRGRSGGRKGSGRSKHKRLQEGVDVQILFGIECVDEGGVAGDVILTSQQRCTEGIGRRLLQSRESGPQARRPRVERKREKLEAWNLRTRRSEQGLMPWRRRKEYKEGRVSLPKEEGIRKMYGESSWKSKMRPRVARNWTSRRKSRGRLYERSTDWALLHRKCRRTSRSHCSISCKRWRKGGMISCLSTRGCKRSHKRHKASKTRGKYAERQLGDKRRNVGNQRTI